MLPRQEILNLLSTIGVNLPRNTKLPDAELDARLSKALDSTQYLTRVLPDLPLDPTAYPSWPDDKFNHSVLKTIMRHNMREATLIIESHGKGIDKLYSNSFMGLRQCLKEIGTCCDARMLPMIFKDEAKSSSICMRPLEVRMFDANTPIVILLYNPALSGATVRFDWLESIGIDSTAMFGTITATLQEQELLLRLLEQNSKRLAQTYNPKRAATESGFTLSFLLPVGPLSATDVAVYNTNNGCPVCGDPANSKCSRCGVVRYCDAVCQKDDWKKHKPLCNSWQGATWQRVTFALAAQNMLGTDFSRYDILQHDVMQTPLDGLKDSQGPPENTHGAAPFIVKIQVSSSDAMGPARQEKQKQGEGADILIYDQTRSLNVTVLRELSNYRAVLHVVQKRGDRGLEMFCWAIRTGEWTIDICLDQFPKSK
ncbi:hypothetical protein GGX14DRAFT_627398 [Mycena pura]|uniref:MYND-type domain-containing protein n=1 Tax=Mycena pura TaxID=153505 RepID=A0AAD7E3K6_9AGAR|nr:hypothetical protein GGX14DRAFT_627398 [Mycena pura]